MLGTCGWTSVERLRIQSTGTIVSMCGVSCGTFGEWCTRIAPSDASVVEDDHNCCQCSKLNGSDAVRPEIECTIDAQNTRDETQRWNGMDILRWSDNIRSVDDAIANDA